MLKYDHRRDGDDAPSANTISMPMFLPACRTVGASRLSKVTSLLTGRFEVARLSLTPRDRRLPPLLIGDAA